MTDEPVSEPVKTGNDLRLEAIEKEMAEMRAAYQNQVKELTDANKDLWAALHPVKDEGNTYVAEPDNKNLRPQADVLDEMIRKKLGIKV